MENLVKFMSQNSIYIVLTIVLIIWAGIFSFMMMLDRRLKKIENEMKSK